MQFLSLRHYFLYLNIIWTLTLKVSQSVYCFTTSISHGVENYFPRLWGTGISDAIFINLIFANRKLVRSTVLSNGGCQQANYVHPPGGGHIIFAFSAVRRHTWFPDILGNTSYPIFTKFGMQVYWVNSLYGIW